MRTSDPDARRVPALDGIRGIAITLVMLLHAASAYVPGGAIGVDLFFALSAFLITTLILNEKASTGAVSFRRFYERRARRLGPALLIWLAIVAPVTAIAIDEVDSIFSSTIASLLYFGNYAVGFGWVPIGGAYSQIWSLAIEEQFYLVWPVTLVWLSTRLSRRSLVTLLAAVLALGCGVQLVVDNVYFLPWGHTAGIIGGCLLALVMHQGLHSKLRPLLSSEALPLVLLGLLAVLALGIDRLPTGVVPAAFVLAGLAGCGLIGHVTVRETSLTSRLLSISILRWLGRRSYGLYLYHRTLAILVPTLIPGITLKFAGPLVLAISFVIAELSWRLVERPVLRGRRTESRGPAGAAPRT